MEMSALVELGESADALLEGRLHRVNDLLFGELVIGAGQSSGHNLGEIVRDGRNLCVRDDRSRRSGAKLAEGTLGPTTTRVEISVPLADSDDGRNTAFADQRLLVRKSGHVGRIGVLAIAQVQLTVRPLSEEHRCFTF